MKKIISIMMIAALAASCTYKSDDPSMRTPDNLAYLCNSLVNSSVTAAVLVLCDTDDDNIDCILSAPFDTLVTADAFKDRFGYVASEMNITLTADSTWTFASNGTGQLAFSGTLRMTGRATDKSPLISATYNGVYDEGNGFTADFSSPNIDFNWEYVPSYYEGYGYYNQYTLMRKGKAYLTTYNNSVKLDDFNLSYEKSEIKY